MTKWFEKRKMKNKNCTVSTCSWNESSERRVWIACESVKIRPLCFFLLFSIVPFQFFEELLFRLHNTGSFATAIRTEPLAFGFRRQRYTRKMKPFDGTQIVVAQNHFAERYLIAQAIGRFVRIDCFFERWRIVMGARIILVRVGRISSVGCVSAAASATAAATAAAAATWHALRPARFAFTLFAGTAAVAALFLILAAVRCIAARLLRWAVVARLGLICADRICVAGQIHLRLLWYVWETVAAVRAWCWQFISCATRTLPRTIAAIICNRRIWIWANIWWICCIRTVIGCRCGWRHRHRCTFVVASIAALVVRTQRRHVRWRTVRMRILWHRINQRWIVLDAIVQTLEIGIQLPCLLIDHLLQLSHHLQFLVAQLLSGNQRLLYAGHSTRSLRCCVRWFQFICRAIRPLVIVNVNVTQMPCKIKTKIQSIRWNREKNAKSQNASSAFALHAKPKMCAKFTHRDTEDRFRVFVSNGVERRLADCPPNLNSFPHKLLSTLLRLSQLDLAFWVYTKCKRKCTQKRFTVFVVAVTVSDCVLFTFDSSRKYELRFPLLFFFLSFFFFTFSWWNVSAVAVKSHSLIRDTYLENTKIYNGADIRTNRNCSEWALSCGHTLVQ